MQKLCLACKLVQATHPLCIIIVRVFVMQSPRSRGQPTRALFIQLACTDLTLNSLYNT
jgi:hypothetical protein